MILVTGATGLLGSSLVPYMKKCGHSVITLARSGDVDVKADLSNSGTVLKLLNKINPKVIINLVGLTDVDKCEEFPDQAYKINVKTVENIVSWSLHESRSCHLVHVSTDQVYDENGEKQEHQVALKNYYAFSKYMAELVASSVSSTILRTNFFGRSQCIQRSSLTDWLYSSLEKSDLIQVFDDVFFNPLSIPKLLEIIELVTRVKPPGIFNLGSHDGISKAKFAFEFAKEVNLLTNNMSCISIDEASFLHAYRPKDMRMDCSKIEKTLNVKLPTLIDEIKLVAKEYYENG